MTETVLTLILVACGVLSYVLAHLCVRGKMSGSVYVALGGLVVYVIVVTTAPMLLADAQDPPIPHDESILYDLYEEGLVSLNWFNETQQKIRKLRMLGAFIGLASALAVGLLARRVVGWLGVLGVLVVNIMCCARRRCSRSGRGPCRAAP